MRTVIIIGAGAAGLMAAAWAGSLTHTVLLEQNEKAGKKIYITGKGRCNFTNDCAPEEFFAHVPDNPKFLYSALYTFPPEEVIAYFRGLGMAVKTERGRRAFPVSDHASDVTKALLGRLAEEHVELRYRTAVTEILTKDGAVTGVRLSDGSVLYGDAVIVATGGCSYPSTGATGDGYRFAEALSHKLTERRPALVGMRTKETFDGQLAGLSLKNIEIRLYDGEKVRYREFGELLFTHTGVSGPVILSAGFAAGDCLKKRMPKLSIDFKPALDRETLDRRLQREFSETPNASLKTVFAHLVPGRLANILPEYAGIDEKRHCNAVTKAERTALTEALKDFRLTVTGLGGFDEAIITRGGVSVREIDPSTMESKRVRGLYFAGEVLDVAAYTGGYNLQIAWATGRLAGVSAGGDVCGRARDERRM